MRKIFTHKITFQAYYWLVFMLIFFLILAFFQPALFSLKIVLVIVLPVIPCVYIHFYIFDKYFIKRKFLVYTVLLILLLFAFAFLAQFIADNTVNKEDSYFGGYLNPLFFILLTTGIKAFKDKLNDKYLLQQAIIQQAETELKLKEIEEKHVKSELELLKSQVNPHFLFNTLNSIYSMALYNSEETADAVMKLSDLMRYLLESSKRKIVALIQEHDFIENYLALEKIRLKNKATINFTVEGDIKSKTIQPMLLIPFVENVFKHGISIKPDENLIDINLQLQDGNLVFKTKNNIASKNKGPEDKEVKTGIKNVKKRLELLYPDKHKLEITENNDIFRVDLKIEL